MGTGTDVAIEASDLTLVRGDLRGAVDAIRLSRRTLATIKGNLFWAFAYNIAALPRRRVARPDAGRGGNGVERLRGLGWPPPPPLPAANSTTLQLTRPHHSHCRPADCRLPTPAQRAGFAATDIGLRMGQTAHA